MIDTLLKLKIGERFQIDNQFEVIRVPGGWIYKYFDLGVVLCFVPEPKELTDIFINEKTQKELEELKEQIKIDRDFFTEFENAIIEDGYTEGAAKMLINKLKDKLQIKYLS